MSEILEVITRNQPVKLEEAAIRQRSSKLASTVSRKVLLQQEQAALKEHAKTQVRDMQDQIDVLAMEEFHLARIVLSRVEYQDVECEVVPELVDQQHMVNIVRKDIGEVIETRPMTREERQIVLKFPDQLKAVEKED